MVNFKSQKHTTNACIRIDEVTHSVKRAVLQLIKELTLSRTPRNPKGLWPYSQVVAAPMTQSTIARIDRVHMTTSNVIRHSIQSLKNLWKSSIKNITRCSIYDRITAAAVVRNFCNKSTVEFSRNVTKSYLHKLFWTPSQRNWFTILYHLHNLPSKIVWTGD